MTPHGAGMLDKSRWLTVLVIGQLLVLGVPRENILVEQMMGTEELDCVANIQGSTILFEFKGKTFSIGDAYSFSSKINIVRPEVSVIVTTEHVGNDAKAYFSRSNASGRPPMPFSLAMANDEEDNSIVYIEGVSALQAGIEALVTRLSTEDAKRQVERSLSTGLFDASAMVSGWSEKQTD